MSLVRWGRPRGAVHDVAKALDYGDGGANVLVLSDAALYAVQNFAGHELEFLSRWADEVTENGFVPISEESANYEAWHEMVLRIQAELITVAEIDAHQYVYDGTQWVKAAPSFGFTAPLRVQDTTTNLSAGTNTRDAFEVPGQWVYVVTNYNFRYIGTITNVAVTLYVKDDEGAYKSLVQYSPIISGKQYSGVGWWPLAVGEKWTSLINGATAGDDWFIDLTGFMFAVT